MKEDDILDDFTEPELPHSRKGVDKIILTYTIITAFAIFIYELIFKKTFPNPLFGIDGSESILLGILLYIICFSIVKKLNNIAPTAHKYLFIIWGGSAIFYGDLLYGGISEFLIDGNFFPSVLWFIVKISMIKSLVAGALCYLNISDIRGANTTIPYLILIFISIALYFLIKIVY